MANEATGRESDKFMLRLPDGMRDRIAEAAKANNRSMNAEIVSRLEASLRYNTEDASFIFRQHDDLLDLNIKYSELQDAYKRLMDELDKRKLIQDEDLSVRSREAAAAAMTVVVHGYLSASSAVERRSYVELNTALHPVLNALERAINSEDPYMALQEIRNGIVHPQKAKMQPAHRAPRANKSKGEN